MSVNVRLLVVGLILSVTACGDAVPGESCGACYDWQKCEGTSCVADDYSQWSVTALSGFIAGGNWDALGGAPDPFVCAKIYGVGSCSTTAQDTFSPYWNQVLIYDVTALQLKSGVEITITDEDFSYNDVVCSGTIYVTDSDLRSGGFSFSCSDGSHVEFALDHL